MTWRSKPRVMVTSVCVAILLFLNIFQSFDNHVPTTTKKDLEWVATSANAKNETIKTLERRKDEDSSTLPPTNNYDEQDTDCPFRDSPMYRSIYVYPSPGEVEWQGDILSGIKPPKWPWLELQRVSKAKAKVHYKPNGMYAMFATEILIQLLLKHPDSCLRTKDPEAAKLFYVPYMPSIEYHKGREEYLDYQTSPFGRALIDCVQGDYKAWRQVFGLTSKYWQRRNGSDHILVFSEPLQGLFHPRQKRGNFHYVRTQRQLTPPVVMSIELSTTFVQQYPNCARKNILLPYPNIDGDWFNGQLNEKYAPLLSHDKSTNNRHNNSTTNSLLSRPRPNTQYYSAGQHGSCPSLRKALEIDYKCSESGKWHYHNYSNQTATIIPYEQGYRQATFCPCPAGDSPSAKRMFDALHAGCIPIILSRDFVWPFSHEFDKVGNLTMLDPNKFSIRLDSKLYETPRRNETTCELLNAKNTDDLQSFLETIPTSRIDELRRQALEASHYYSWYERDPHLPSNPLQHDVLPTGPVAHAVVQAWAERAKGALWPACQDELLQLRAANGGKRPRDAEAFLC